MTAVNFEVGQVVPAGQPVITVARPDVREAVIDVPNDAAASLKEGSPFEVALLIAPSVRSSGRVRLAAAISAILSGVSKASVKVVTTGATLLRPASSATLQ